MNPFRSLWIAVAIAAIGTASSTLFAQTDVSGTPDGHPDLNGTWYNGDGVLHVRPVRKGASLCIRGCESEAVGPAPARVPVERPSYKPEFVAKVRDLDDRQVAEDPAVLAEPWEKQTRIGTLTDRELVPAPPCIERDIDHIVDGTHHDNRR